MLSFIKWGIVMIITPTFTVYLIIVLFDSAKKKYEIILFSLFSNVFKQQNNGISKNRQKEPEIGIFTLFLEINHKKKYSDRFSFAYSFGLNDVILAKNGQQRGRRKSERSKNCHASCPPYIVWQKLRGVEMALLCIQHLQIAYARQG